MKLLPLLLSVALWSPLQAKPATTLEIREAVQNLLKTLSPEERSAVTFPFQDTERQNWDYVPRERAGLKLLDLKEPQQDLVTVLLKASLSAKGVSAAENIILLEQILFEQSQGANFRNPGNYTITVFGRPDAEKPWGWRFEGHHLSLNFTFAGEKGALATPFFLGANPAEVRGEAHHGLRVLGAIEDAARSLAGDIHGEGLHVRFTMKPPGEIITRQKRTAQALASEGIAADALPTEHQARLLALVEMIAAHQKAEFLVVKREDLEQAQFAWAGAFEKGEPHYFRIQTPAFLIEYANVQNQGNHAHLVWRNFGNDFGGDLLKEHFAEE